MPNLVPCSHCGRPLRLPDNAFGKKVRCPACGLVFRAEAGAAAPPGMAVQPCPGPVVPAPSVPGREAPIATRPLAPAGPPRPSRTARPEEEPVVLSAVRPRSGARRPRHPRPVFLFLLAALPLGIPAVTFLGVFIADMSTVLAAVLGIGLGLCLAAVGVGLALVNWPVVLRALLSVGFTGAGYLAAGAVLVVCLFLNASTFNASDWKEFKPAGGGFHVLMPGTPKAQTRIVRSVTGPRTMQLFDLQIQAKDFGCSVLYLDLSPRDVAVVPIEQRFDAGRNEVIKKLPGARLHAERDITLDGHRGRECEVEFAHGYYLQRNYVVVAGGRWRVYLLAVAGSRVRPGCADARKFFDSFVLDTLPDEPPAGPPVVERRLLRPLVNPPQPPPGPGNIPPPGQVAVRPGHDGRVPAAGSWPDDKTPPPEIKAPAFDQDKVVHPLPSTVEDVAVGGGGRYLILHLPRLGKLAVFDVNEAKVVQYLSLAEAHVKFTAGKNKLMVAYPDKHIVQRWSLTNFKREATFPVKADIKQFVMGSASSGPLLAGGNLLDIQTLKPLGIRWPDDNPFGLPDGDGVFVRASADGTVFGKWTPNVSPEGLHTFVREGNGLKQYYQHDTVGHIVPGPDGRIIFTTGGLYTNQLKLIRPRARDLYCVPAQDPNYYLGINLGGKHSVALYLVDSGRLLLQLPHVKAPANISGWDREKLGTDKRIHFIPAAKLLVVIPETNDQLVLYRLDIDEALKKSGVDYLFVTSRPPSTVVKGRTYTYRLAVKSSKGGVKYLLESGPDGMAITPGGKITWRVPADFAQAETTIIVSIDDRSGQKALHSFQIAIRPS